MKIEWRLEVEYITRVAFSLSEQAPESISVHVSLQWSQEKKEVDCLFGNVPVPPQSHSGSLLTESQCPRHWGLCLCPTNQQQTVILGWMLIGCSVSQSVMQYQQHQQQQGHTERDAGQVSTLLQNSCGHLVTQQTAQTQGQLEHGTWGYRTALWVGTLQLQDNDCGIPVHILTAAVSTFLGVPDWTFIFGDSDIILCWHC